MNRKDKIQLLKDIEAGRMPLGELNKKPLAIYYCNEMGLYGVGEQTLNQQQFEQYQIKHPAKQTIVYRYQQGNEPLID